MSSSAAHGWDGGVRFQREQKLPGVSGKVGLGFCLVSKQKEIIIEERKKLAVFKTSSCVS